jgi:hypothetical protein
LDADGSDWQPGRKYRLKEFLRGVFGISARQTPQEGLTDKARWRALASPVSPRQSRGKSICDGVLTKHSCARSIPPSRTAGVMIKVFHSRCICAAMELMAGTEIAQCLNKGGGDTGPSYLPSKLGCLRGHRVDIWFGGRDKLVEPRAQGR